MATIQYHDWDNVSVYTWGYLASNRWEEFNLAVFENETEMTVRNYDVQTGQAYAWNETNAESTGIKIDFSSTLYVVETEMIANPTITRRSYFDAMYDYLPEYEKRSPQFQQLLSAYDVQLRAAEQAIDALDNNLFIGSSVELIGLYERDLGLGLNESLLFDQRREIIADYYQRAFSPTQLQTIKDIAQQYGNGEVEVTAPFPDNPYKFAVRFKTHRGEPNRFKEIQSEINKVKPAHTTINTFIINPL